MLFFHYSSTPILNVKEKKKRLNSAHISLLLSGIITRCSFHSGKKKDEFFTLSTRKSSHHFNPWQLSLAPPLPNVTLPLWGLIPLLDLGGV